MDLCGEVIASDFGRLCGMASQLTVLARSLHRENLRILDVVSPLCAVMTCVFARWRCVIEPFSRTFLLDRGHMLLETSTNVPLALHPDNRPESIPSQKGPWLLLGFLGSPWFPWLPWLPLEGREAREAKAYFHQIGNSVENQRISRNFEHWQWQII